MGLLLIKVEKIFIAKFTKYFIKRIDSPFWAFAIHDGQQIDPFIDPYINLKEDERLREEDPFTAVMAELPMNQFIVGSSRFQLDLNRKLQDSVYLRPDQAWGLEVWKDSRSEEHTSELQSRENLVCRLLLEKKKKSTSSRSPHALHIPHYLQFFFY